VGGGTAISPHVSKFDKCEHFNFGQVEPHAWIGTAGARHKKFGPLERAQLLLPGRVACSGGEQPRAQTQRMQRTVITSNLSLFDLADLAFRSPPPIRSPSPIPIP